ncbi:MAG TPA: proline dipeptidase [Firmicutes bacterium]|nr:proline dipeptidase [Bacillota bacterium]
MELLKKYTLEVKKSKFIGLCYLIDSTEQVKEILEDLKKEHKKARHMPYACKFFNTAKKSDDKEPSNTAGLPIYNILEQKNLNSHLVVVIRYFGGIKLGAGGLLRAYMNTANEVTKDL